MIKWRLIILAWICIVDAAWAVDPTRPPEGRQSASATAESLRLHGVILGRKPLAIINGVGLHAGDRWKNLKVIRIDKNSVLLEVDGQRRWLSVNAMRIKRNQR